RQVGGTWEVRLWVDQTDPANPSFDEQTLPNLLPNGDTALFENLRMWVSNTSDIYIAAQDTQTYTLWLLHTYLGDGDWSNPNRWTMRQLDSFPTAGADIHMAGSGKEDYRILYEVGLSSKIRL